MWIVGTGPIGGGRAGERDRARLAAALQRALERDVEVRAAVTYSELLDWVGAREVHLAWLGPALFVQAQARFGVDALVRSERDGTQSFRGALFVREDSPRRTPEDLRGAKVAWVDPDSCSGFLFPRLAMSKRGLDPDTTFDVPRILGSHEAVVRAVAEGVADVGATFVELRRADDPRSEIVRAGWSGGPCPMRAVLLTEPIPSDVVVATRAVDPAMRAVLTRGLERLGGDPDGRAVLAQMFQADRLCRVAAEDYSAVRTALRAAGVRL